MSASDGNDKERLKREIAAVEGQVRQALGDAGDVDWRIWFAEVFAAHDGFDIVIANPPYIQLQKDEGKLANRYQGVGYKTFVRTGDVYQLFYERGCQLLTPGRGMLAYITSNSWLKTEYGRRLRRYFAEGYTPLRLLDLGKDTFESAIVDTCVLMLREGGAAETFAAVNMDSLATKDIPPREELWGGTTPNGAAPWSILSRSEQRVVEKMRATGTPLGEWDVKINVGIKTGYNPAFIIDDETRRVLVDTDPRSSEVLTPILRGRDVQSYRAQWAGWWLIDTHNGYGHVPAVNIDDYPAVKSYLYGFYSQLVKRKDNVRTPYNLRNCAYYEEFSKRKLFWRRVTSEGKFAYVEENMQCINAVIMLSGKPLKYLCGVLNAKLISWFMQRSLPTSGTGTFHWEKVHVERLPIPIISAVDQRPFIQLVDGILKAKASDPNADTGAQEVEIDRLVYELYGLTDEEIAVVKAG